MIHADVCSPCHPFYTGKQKILDTGGRVARFEQRFGKRSHRSSDLAAPDPDGAAPTGAAPFAVRTDRRDLTEPMTGAIVFEHVDDAARRVRRPRGAARRPGGARRPGRARELGRRYAELGPVVARSASWRRCGTTSRPPASWPPRTRRSPPRPSSSSARRAELDGRLRDLLVPRDPDDGKDVILEVKAGEGGDESALFAGDLLRMYRATPSGSGWKTEVLDATESDLGGYKDVAVAVKSRATRAGDGVWAG